MADKGTAPSPGTLRTMLDWLLAPVADLMNGLKYPQKFALISLVFTIPLGVAIFLLMSAYNARITTSQDEIRGVRYLVPLRRLLEHVPESRRLAHLYAAEGKVALRTELLKTQSEIDDDFDALEVIHEELGQRLAASKRHDVLNESWRFLKVKTRELESSDTDQLYASLIQEIRSLISHVGDTSNLILDPDLDTYYLKDSVLLKLPESADLVARARMTGESILLRQKLTADEKAQFTVLAGLIHSNMDALLAGLDVALRSTVDPDMDRNLRPSVQQFKTASEELLTLTEDRLLNADAITLVPEAYVTSASRVLEAGFFLWDRAAAELSRLTDARINRFVYWKRVVQTLSLLAAVVVVFLLVGFYRTVMHTVRGVQAASQRMVSGDMSVTLRLETGDELNEVVTAFNNIAQRLTAESTQSREATKRLEESELELRRQNQFLATLHETTLGVMNRHNVRELLQALLDSAVLMMGAKDGYVYLVEPDDPDAMLLRVGVGLFVDRVGMRLDPGDGVAGTVWKTGQPLAVNDYPAWPGRTMTFATAPLLAVAGAPLRWETLVVGVIGIALVEPGQKFEKEHLDLLVQLAQLASIVLGNARLDTAGQQKTAVVELLRDIAVVANDAASVEAVMQIAVDRVCAHMGWPLGHVHLLDREGSSGMVPTRIWHAKDPECHNSFRAATEQMSFARGAELPGRVLASARPEWNLDVLGDPSFTRAKFAEETGLRAGFAFPVLVGREAVAVLEFYAERGKEPEEQMLSMMSNVGALIGCVMERKRVEAELQKAKNVAEEANRAKSRLLATMSHELRTPLNAIIGYSDMLIEEADEMGNTAIVPDVQKIHSAGKHLLALINDILDLSKIEADKMELFVEDMDVATLAEDVTSLIRPLLLQNGNTMKLGIPANLGRMRGDMTRVRQVLFNLLSNASKFTDHGIIELDVRRDQNEGRDWLVFRIADTGIGMSPDQLSRLFQAFTQADGSTTRKYGGTGLGLVISQRFARLMGGDIEVQSSLGQGSTFTVILPAEISDRIEAAEGAKPLAEATKAMAEAWRGGGSGLGTILVIDDEPSIRDMMVRCLSKEGFRVETAVDGPEALIRAKELRPDGITLDVMMAGMNGWEVLAALKADPELAPIPVVVVSGGEESALGRSLGASDSLTKPVDKRMLADRLRHFCEDRASFHVLVVEDDEPTRNMIVHSLRRKDWKITSASGGRRALELVAESAPDLILLDLNMPEMDGFEFITKLRQTELGRTIPVIVLTALDLSAEERVRLDIEVAQVLTKAASGREALMRELKGVLKARVGRKDPEPVEVV